MRRSYFLAAFLSLLFFIGFPVYTFSLDSFVEFESGQVRPLALSADGTRLFAVNTPDNRLEIFDVTGVGLTHTASIPVGMEPVAVAVRNQFEVWVVNHLSDSVSIVSVGLTPPRVTKTLLVGDEPRDIVFAGTGGNRAFITTAHRGQQRTDSSISSVPGAGDPQLTTAGVGRADVWVFDATSLGSAFGGAPIKIIVLFGDTPRALTVSPDGNTVYAAGFHTGNQTTTVPEPLVCNGGDAAGSCNPAGAETFMPGGLPAPNGTAAAFIGGKNAPETGLIIKYNQGAGQWQDQLGRNWNNAVKFNLPDKDVFAINANTNLETVVYTSVGTVLFNMIVNPVSGKVYVTNTDARNEVRFEGPGITSTTVRGHLAESRVTVLSGSTVTPRHLNKHINYSAVPQPAGTKEDSLATPMGMAISSDGSTLYVAALGSSKIGIFNTSELENDTFAPDSSNHISLTGVRGPTGLVLDEANNRLYVLARFDNTVAVVDLATKAETQTVQLFNPEPPEITDGRLFLYDAVFTSSNGEASCSSCHIFGDMDDLGWDLGNPDGGLVNIPFEPDTCSSPGEIKASVFDTPACTGGSQMADHDDFHPMKGPMTTQTLRGMVNHGAMHWRGDRTGGNDGGPGAGNPFDSHSAFVKFNVAFDGLVGRDEGQIPAISMDAFADFILRVMLPPNPIRNLDNSLTADQQAGSNFFFNTFSDGVASPLIDGFTSFKCNGCHTINPASGFFGADGIMSFENEPQLVKIPHLRNLYQKIGMFGMADTSFFLPGDNGNKGDQIRGFGFLHDGSVDTLFRFVRADVFDTQGGSFGFQNDTERRQVEQFLLASPTDLAPIVGQQITLTNANGAAVDARIDLLIARAAAGDCDLIVKGAIDGEARGWLRQAGGLFKSDKTAESDISDAALRLLVNGAGEALTYTAVPPGSGTRMGIDRDLDGTLDGDENSPPAISSFQPGTNNPSVIVGNAINFSISASDPELDPLTYAWTIDNVDQGNNSPSFVYAPSNANAGTRIIVVSVSDGSFITTKTWTVNVQQNLAPQISVITNNSGGAVVASPFQATMNQRYSWTIHVQDDGPSYVVTAAFNDGFNTTPIPACTIGSTADLCVARIPAMSVGGCRGDETPKPASYWFYFLAKSQWAGQNMQVTFSPVEAQPNVNPGTPVTVTIQVPNPNAPFQNQANRYDVNASGSVTPLDALIVINRLRIVGPGPVSALFSSTSTVSPLAAARPRYYYDVSGDNYISPIDALQVINYLLKKK